MPTPRYAATNVVTLYTLYFPRLPTPDIRGVVIRRGTDLNYAMPALIRDMWRSIQKPIEAGVLGDAAAEDNTGKVVVEPDGSILVVVAEDVFALLTQSPPFVIFGAEPEAADKLSRAEAEEEKRTQGGRVLPNLINQTKNFIGAVTTWATEGFPLASKDVYESRLTICKTCPEFDPNGFGPGLVRCRKCGCSGAKLHMETSTCPLTKW